MKLNYLFDRTCCLLLVLDLVGLELLEIHLEQEKKGWVRVRSQQKTFWGQLGLRLYGRARGTTRAYSIHSRFLASAARTADSSARRVSFVFDKSFFNSFRSVI